MGRSAFTYDQARFLDQHFSIIIFTAVFFFFGSLSLLTSLHLYIVVVVAFFRNFREIPSFYSFSTFYSNQTDIFLCTHTRKKNQICTNIQSKNTFAVCKAMFFLCIYFAILLLL